MRCRTAGVVTLAVILLIGCTRTASPASEDVGAPGIDLSAAEPIFALGEPVRLSVRITNTWTQPCRLTTAPIGALTVLELTRNGTPLAPQLTVASFINGFLHAVQSRLVQVQPGESVTFEYAGQDGTLDSYAADARGGAEVNRWPVDAPGRYELTVAYLRPPLPGVPADPCQASGTTASVNFIVEAS